MSGANKAVNTFTKPLGINIKKPFGGTGAGASKRARQAQEKILKAREAEIASEEAEQKKKDIASANARRKTRKKGEGIASLLSKDTGFTGVLGGGKTNLGGGNGS